MFTVQVLCYPCHAKTWTISLNQSINHNGKTWSHVMYSKDHTRNSSSSHITMNDLSMHLNSSGIGGYLGTAFINHLCYADNLCLISLSSSGMQQLLHICNEYAGEHQLIYNGSKSFSLCFKRKDLKISPPTFFLDQSKIPLVEQCRYLGQHC